MAIKLGAFADQCTPGDAGEKPQQDPETGRFLPGNSGFGGRPRGSRNKLAQEFFDVVYNDWFAGGAEAVERTRKEQPAVYLRVVAALMPQQIEVKEAAFDGLSDEQLSALIAAARATVAVRGADGAGANETAH